MNVGSFFNAHKSTLFCPSNRLYLYQSPINKRYSAIVNQPPANQMQHLIQTYCDFFTHLFSIECPPKSNSLKLKKTIDQKLGEVGQATITHCFKQCFGKDPLFVTPMEEVACWLEAGITPSTDTLNAAIANSKSIGAIKILIQFGAIVQSSTIDLAIRRGFSETDVKYLASLVQENLSADVLVAAIRSKLKLVQFFVAHQAPVSQQAVMACLETKSEFKVLEYVFEAYVKQRSSEQIDLQLALDSFLHQAIQLKRPQEVTQFFLNKGARVSSHTLEFAIKANAPMEFIKALMETLRQNIDNPDYNQFLMLAIPAGYSDHELDQFAGFGACINISSLNQIFSSNCGQTDLEAREILKTVSYFLKKAKPTEETLNLALERLALNRQNASLLEQILERLLNAGAVPSQKSLDLAEKRTYSLAWMKNHLVIGEVKPTKEMLEEEIRQKKPDLNFIAKCIETGLEITCETIDLAVKGRSPRQEGRVELVNRLLHSMKKGRLPYPSALEAALRQNYPHETIVAFLNTGILQVLLRPDFALRIAIDCGYEATTIQFMISKWGLKPSFETVLVASSRGRREVSSLVETARDYHEKRESREFVNQTLRSIFG